MSSVRLEPLKSLPHVRAGDHLGTLLRAALETLEPPAYGDVLVVAQKVVSKAEGRSVLLSDVKPSKDARELATQTHKDPRIVELVLRESKRIVRAVPNVLIVEHKLGLIQANAGVDCSNTDQADSVLLLPENPDASAQAIATLLSTTYGFDLPVIVNDSSGRPWRNGVVGVAIGCAGLAPLWDRRGASDLNGRALEVTEVGIADELAAAASLVMGQGDEGVAAVLVRGALTDTRAMAHTPDSAEQGIAPLLRTADKDLFR